MIQVFLHLPGIIYVKKRMVGPHSGTGPEWALLWAERPQHVNLFPPQINIAQNQKNSIFTLSAWKTHKHYFFKNDMLKLSLPSQWKQGRMGGMVKHAATFSLVFLNNITFLGENSSNMCLAHSISSWATSFERMLNRILSDSIQKRPTLSFAFVLMSLSLYPLSQNSG